jgi:hypothetical protein
MTIADDNLGLHTRGRSSTVPDDRVYAAGIKKFLAFSELRNYKDTSSLADIDYLLANTVEDVKISSRDRPESPREMNKKYPVIIRIGAAAVVPATIIAAGVGYFVPGRITGIAIAITITLWWVLYRTTLKYDSPE